MLFEFSHLYDEKSKCHSMLTTVTLDWYFSYIEHAYSEKGAIAGQRPPLETKSGQRIRKKMIDDFSAGSVLPPVVIGIEKRDLAENLQINTPDELKVYLESIPRDDISILDGMQRTTAMFESKAPVDRPIRVEFWIAEKVHSLLYRMLVLNTGQVPWSLRRQIEVVFHSLKKDMMAAVPNLNLIEVDDGNRRRNGGTFQADKLIEIFLILGTRTERVDVKEKLADDFLKLDFIESSSDKELTVIFFKLVSVIVDFDLAISDAKSPIEGRFTHGYELFASQPLLTGFALASSLFLLGRPGTTRTSEELSTAIMAFETGFQTLIARIKAMTPTEKEAFLALEFLNEQMKSFKSGSKVGDEERNFFKTAFRVIFQDNFEVPSMEVCWRV